MIDAPKSSASDVTQTVWIIVLVVMALYFYGNKSIKQLRDYLLYRRLKRSVAGYKARPESPEQVEHLCDATCASGEQHGLERMEGGSMRLPGGALTTLTMTMPNGNKIKVKVDLETIETMRELQTAALECWTQAGGDRRENLMMEHVDAHGRATKVSKVTTLSMLRKARSLSLLPKRCRNTPSSSANRLGRQAQVAASIHSTGMLSRVVEEME